MTRQNPPAGLRALVNFDRDRVEGADRVITVQRLEIDLERMAEIQIDDHHRPAGILLRPEFSDHHLRGVGDFVRFRHR